MRNYEVNLQSPCVSKNGSSADSVAKRGKRVGEKVEKVLKKKKKAQLRQLGRKERDREKYR